LFKWLDKSFPDLKPILSRQIRHLKSKFGFLGLDGALWEGVE
jgi:hypothetical protein